MALRIGQPDRRTQVRDRSGTEPTRTRLIALILGNFSEMPGLSLHLNQAARLFGLRLSTCDAVLRDLVTDGELRRTGDGQYVTGQAEDAESGSVPMHEHGAAISKRGR